MKTVDTKPYCGEEVAQNRCSTQQNKNSFRVRFRFISFVVVCILGFVFCVLFLAAVFYGLNHDLLSYGELKQFCKGLAVFFCFFTVCLPIADYLTHIAFSFIKKWVHKRKAGEQ